MGIMDNTALSAVLKVQYTEKTVRDLTYPQNPLYAMMQKDTKMVGDYTALALKIGTPQGRGANFAVAQGNITPSVYKKFQLTRVSGYAFAEITGEAIDSSDTDAGALVKGLTGEIDGALQTDARAISIQMFGNGGGARGRISAGSSVASTTITLSNPADVTNFEDLMYVNLGSTDGTSGSKRTGVIQIVALDRDAGTLTASAAWNTITGAAAGDYIFQNGDFESANSCIAGLAGWIPLTAPGSTPWFSVDRSVDPTRLGGVRVTQYSGAPIATVLTNLASKIALNGGSPDVAVMNPADWVRLDNELDTKGRYDKATSADDAAIGFDAITVMGPKGKIKVISDLNCPQGIVYMLTLNTWKLHSLKGASRILDLDSNQLLRAATSDSYQIRIGGYRNVGCVAPGWNGVGLL